MTDPDEKGRESKETMTSEIPSNKEAEFFETIFINSPIGIYILQEGKFVFVNPEFQRISGYEQDELLHKHSSMIVLPEDWEGVKEKAVKMLKGERSAPYVYRALNRDGEIRWIIETVTSINYGGRSATLGYFMDNTAQELAKEALRISEEKFQKAFRAIPDPVVISRLKDGVFLDVNEAFLRSAGYLKEEVVGRTSIELGVWPDHDARAEMVRRLREEGAVRDLETRFRLKSGEIRFVMWSAELIDYGYEKCLIALARDITARKRAELDLAPQGGLYEG